MNFNIIRTDTADENIHNIILYIARSFGTDVALQKLDEIETEIMKLAKNPFIGTEPKYSVLRRQGYRVLILKKDLVFYKIDKDVALVTVYAVVDQRQDYLDILRGL